MEETISAYLKGDANSRKQLEQFLESEEFWNLIPVELEKCLSWKEPDLVQFLLMMTSRRLSLHRSEPIPSQVIELFFQFRHLVYSNLLFESLSSSLALITLKQSPHLLESCQFIQQALSDSPILIIKYLTELASLCPESDRLHLQEMRRLVVEYSLEILNSDLDLDQLKASAVTCVRIWMNSHLISHLELLNSNPSNLIQSLSSYSLARNSYPLTLLAIADFYDDILLAIADAGQGSLGTIPSSARAITITGDHTSLTNGVPHSLDPSSSADLSSSHHEYLIHSLAQQSELFHSAITETHSHSSAESSERVSWQHSYIRILAAATKFLFSSTANPFFSRPGLESRICSGSDFLNMIQQISAACSHANITHAVIAMEVRSLSAYMSLHLTFLSSTASSSRRLFSRTLACQWTAKSFSWRIESLL
jgi:hypothetical protein